ncbi:MAG: nuclear transport factor 2 family protein [Ferruginibacter sp.]
MKVLNKSKMTINEVIGKQMKAYNDRDIESMMSLFCEEIKIVNFSDGNVLIDGFEECKKMYSDLFIISPKLRAEIINSITFDNKVIVYEYIFGRNGNVEKMEQVIIFEVNEEKISKINLIRLKI